MVQKYFLVCASVLSILMTAPHANASSEDVPPLGLQRLRITPEQLQENPLFAGAKHLDFQALSRMRQTGLSYKMKVKRAMRLSSSDTEFLLAQHETFCKKLGIPFSGEHFFSFLNAPFQYLAEDHTAHPDEEMFFAPTFFRSAYNYLTDGIAQAI